MGGQADGNIFPGLRKLALTFFSAKIVRRRSFILRTRYIQS